MDFSKTIRKIIHLPAKAVITRMERKEKEPKIIKREEKAKTLFRGKPYITRQWFRRALKRAPTYIPRSRIIPTKERVSIEKNLFPMKRFGYFITPGEYHKRIRELKKEKHYAKTTKAKKQLYRRINFLKDLEQGKKYER